MAGSFDKATDFDPGAASFVLTPLGGLDAFVTKLGAAGDFRWTSRAGGAGRAIANALAIDAAGSVYTTGSFQGTIDFDPGSLAHNLTAAGQEDAYFARWDATGAYVWARSLGSTDYDRGYGIAVGPGSFPAVYATGNFFANATSDPGGSVPITLAAIGSGDMFLTKLVQPAAQQPADDRGYHGQDRRRGREAHRQRHRHRPRRRPDNHLFARPGAPAGASIAAATGVFTWTPTEAQGPGSYVIVVRATDNGSPAATGSASFSVTVREVNRAPVLAAITSQNVFEGVELTLNASATDPDLPANGLAFSLDAGARAGATIDSRTGAFSWTPTEAQGPGTYTITARVTDNGTPSPSSQTFTVSVKEANSVPVLSALTDKTVDEGVTLAVNVTATDPDIPTNVLTYSLDPGAPAGAAIDGKTGALSWTPTEAQGPGTYTITVRVTDNGTPPERHQVVQGDRQRGECPTGAGGDPRQGGG